MKKKIIIISMLLMIFVTLVSCSKSNKYKTYDKDTQIISLHGYSGDDTTVTDIKKITYDGTLKLKFIEDEDYIPYIDPLSYIALLPSYLSSKCTYIDDEKEVDFIFETTKGKASIRIFPKEELVVFEDKALYVIANNGDDSNYYRCVHEDTYNKTKMVNHTINYKEYGFKTFRENDKTYFPLSFLNVIVSYNHDSTAFYNYDKLYVYSNPKALSKFKYSDSGKTTTAIDEMSAKVSDVMPEYLRKFNKNYLYFIFDNFYGLREKKGISKMSTYFESLDYSKKLLDEKGEERANALELMLASLYDGHTAIIDSSKPWNEEHTKTIVQSLRNDRYTLETALKEQREKVYNSLGIKEDGVRYSNDGKTAVVTLDAFSTDDYVYKEDKTPKSDEVLAKTDQFFKLLNNFKEIDKKTGVSNIIIDMSVNSGGDSGTMTRIINLISSTNKANIDFYDFNTNVLHTFSTKIDSNNDGKYDDKDVYGNKYKFFILVSPVAFSCGTALPFIVSQQNIGTIIGQNPGGGECSLAQCVLPNGQHIVYSSSIHVCSIENGNFIGDEDGVETDISFNYFDFYDLEKMNTKIQDYIKIYSA